MASYVCKKPTCTNYVKTRGYCAEHQTHALIVTTTTQFYDQHIRDPAAKKFYNSTAWERARSLKLSEVCWCEHEGCGQPAEHVHHIIELKDCTEEQKTDQANLQAVCKVCHNKIHKTGPRGTPPFTAA